MTEAPQTLQQALSDYEAVRAKLAPAPHTSALIKAVAAADALAKAATFLVDAVEHHPHAFSLDHCTIDRYAQRIVDDIANMQNDGVLPYGIKEFATIHQHIDGNTGWGDDIDNLPVADWIAVQNRVEDLLPD